MKKNNRNRMIAAALVCGLAAAAVSGCANPQKAGARALEEKKYDDALKQFQQAADSKKVKESAEGYRGLGITYYEMEDYESALEAFRKAEDAGSKQTVQTYNLEGICAMKTEDYASALEYIQAGLALADSETHGDSVSDDLIREMKYNEIICYEQQADWESAKKKTEEYLKTYPDDGDMQKEEQFLETR